MKVTEAEIVISAVKPSQYPKEALPEIALAGRSNVGKSSLINKMIQRKGLARTSSKPGKTQTLNFYRINQQFYFVDLPGYGFAKVSKQQRAAWGKMIEEYLTKREELKIVLLITDLRHPPTKDDQMMYEWLKHFRIPVLVIGTKADKIPKGKWEKHRKIAIEILQLAPEDKIVLFSSETGYGKDQLWNEIIPYITNKEENDLE
ncbi:ribosome biogenesis GTP-binding protein YihA/YsxC [Tepidibacillus infernus]|uniref:Probable GTP-binding protein EngB n=1 Tax=Tepidibacillus decaturensis TaxID=1413211 RepID=A0A135L1Y6_9BACI|nr:MULTISPECIES: ribosome biogenesis GTP-binding protein YihA/YsxC [Tepidibacillus]KXG43018.1 GTP-binding protein [Tepidibacillus decaturensis]GBF10850.1 putative GTP-binding protein EngB [Tepidibacillus sp. HK-1]